MAKADVRFTTKDGTLVRSKGPPSRAGTPLSCQSGLGIHRWPTVGNLGDPDTGRRIPVGKIGLYDTYLGTLGGGENFLAVFAELLENEIPGASIDVITHETGNVGIEELVRRFGVTLRRTRVRRVPSRTSTRGPHLLAPMRRLAHERDVSRISASYDLFVNNTVFSLAAPRSKRSMYMCMFPLDPRPSFLQERNFLGSLWAPYVALRRSLYHRWIGSYTLLMANSHFTRSWIRRLWGLPAEVLYPPIEVRGTLPSVRKKPRIVAVGRFFPSDHNKKHDILIQAFRELRQTASEFATWELHLVGGRTQVEGTDQYIAQLQKLAQGEPVFFYFDARRSKLEEILQSASIFWHATGFGEDPQSHPYKLEHFGMSTVEAMGHGCVPVVFRSGGQVEIISHGRNGLLWETLSELQHFTRQLATSTDLLDRMGREAYRRSLDFSRAAFRSAAQGLLDKTLAVVQPNGRSSKE